MIKNFFVICGGYACGTTYLSESLRHHPNIGLIKRKDGREYNFFVNDFFYKKKGVNWYKDLIKKNKKKIIIEHSSQLLSSRKGINRLYNFNKKVKLIILLRNRITRTWADYRYSVLNGWEILPFHLAIKRKKNKKIEKDLKKIQPYLYLERSDYLKQLQYLFKKFNKNNILILNSEDLNKNPKKNFLKVFNFLKVKKCQLKKVSNYSSFFIKNRKKQASLRKYFNNNLNPLIEKIRANGKVEDSNFTPLQKKKFAELKKNILYKVPKIPKKSEEYLKKYFLKSKEKLRKLSGFNL